MKQISYDILELLTKNNAHVREIARILKTNQMTISRELKKLEDKNIIDYKTQGKNYVYFVKSSIEAEELILMMEHNKLLNLISKNASLRKIVLEIKSREEIFLAIIFGSYANNTQTNKSDIDLYIETQSLETKKSIELLSNKLSVKIGKFDTKNSLIEEIIKNHIIIKGVEKFYENLYQENTKTRENKINNS